FFFFQAEDGIRDKLVTGVQTCALPISALAAARGAPVPSEDGGRLITRLRGSMPAPGGPDRPRSTCSWAHDDGPAARRSGLQHTRSEERRVGKECRSRWWGHQSKKKE